MGVRGADRLILLLRRERQPPGEGNDGSTQPAKETCPGSERLD